MADIQAFRAYRYNLGHVGALADVLAPPYDVIDSSLQQTLHNRSPYNVARVDLSKDEPSDTNDNNRYTRAANLLREWIQEGAVKQDTARGLYVCRQEYDVDGQRHVRQGFFARVRLEPFDKGSIFPHEETMAGPKADRLALMHTTAMNLSPIFAMYPDESREVQALLDAAVGRALPLEATDDQKTTSRLWPITDQHVVNQVVGLLGSKPLFIADGHHRYETSLTYRNERRALGDVTTTDSPANFTLMLLVGMSDPGLAILPTHRLVSGISNVTDAILHDALKSHFQIDTIGVGEQAGRTTWEMIESDGGQGVLGFGVAGQGSWHFARLTDLSAMDTLAAEHSSTWRSLAVSILHELVLNKLLPQHLGGQPKCDYTRSSEEAIESVAIKRCPLVVLVPAPTMAHVESIAGHGEKMPPKSTFFYPKVPTGLLFNSLKTN